MKPVSHASVAAFSVTQANRALKRGCQAILAVCFDAQSAADAVCAVDNFAADDFASSMHDKSQLMPESDLAALLHEYDDRFVSALLEGLPPESNIGHTIPLKPGSKASIQACI